MPKNLDFSKLVPERHTFTDEDGKTYEFAAKADFGLKEAARRRVLQKRVDKLMNNVEDGEPTEEQAAEFEVTFDAFTSMLLPDLPKERIQQMKLGQKMAIAEWWTDQQKDDDEDDQGEAGADQPA